MAKVIKIILDPGHGGTDPGAVKNGLEEAAITLKIAKKVKALLEEYQGVEVKLTRSTDTFIELSERADIANKWKADLFISIHINAGGGTGFESFVYNGNVSSETVAAQNVIHAAVIKAVGGTDRGKKRKNLAVLRETKMKALLTEVAFIDTPADAAKLKKDSFLDQAAAGHVNGIVAFYGLKKKKTAVKAAKSTASNIDGKETYYRIVTGSFKDKAKAEDRVADLKKKGFDSFIDVYKK